MIKKNFDKDLIYIFYATVYTGSSHLLKLFKNLKKSLSALSTLGKFFLDADLTNEQKFLAS